MSFFRGNKRGLSGTENFESLPVKSKFGREQFTICKIRQKQVARDASHVLLGLARHRTPEPLDNTEGVPADVGQDFVLS